MDPVTVVDGSLKGPKRAVARVAPGAGSDLFGLTGPSYGAALH
jgi:hypothetical protein